MKIAITTPTGKVGHQVAEMLLNNPMNNEIVLLGRRREALRKFENQGAEIREGDQEDRKWVIQATADIDTLFWVVPPNPKTQNVVEWYYKIGGNGADAVRLNKISRAVLLSSIGAHLGVEGATGPVKGFKQVEEFFRFVTKNLVIARPTYFMENLLMGLESIVTEGKMYMPVRGEAKISMIATRDIAEVTVGFIRRPFKGTHVAPLHGPRDYTFNEAAKIIGKGIGREVEYVSIEPEMAITALTAMGLSRHMANEMVELSDAIDKGRLRPEFPRTADTTTPTTLEEFVQMVLAPMVRKMQEARR